MTRVPNLQVTRDFSGPESPSVLAWVTGRFGRGSFRLESFQPGSFRPVFVGCFNLFFQH